LDGRGGQMEQIGSLEALLDVQGVDAEIDRLLARRSGLPILDEYKATHERLTRIERELGQAREAIRDLALALDRAEGEMGLDEEKVGREERRLYAGGLSARDATHLRDEVEMLRRRISDREDEVLALMEQREAGEARIAELEAAEAEVAAEKARLDAEISAEWSAIDGEVESLRTRKADMIGGVDGELLDLYEDLRPGKDGVAVAVLAERVCGGCHLALSAAEEVQVLKGWPPRCLHCRRILVPR
jgi:uncharacterized protein